MLSREIGQDKFHYSYGLLSHLFYITIITVKIPCIYAKKKQYYFSNHISLMSRKLTEYIKKRFTL